MNKRTLAQALEESAQQAKSFAEAQELSLRASKLQRAEAGTQASRPPLPLFRN
ncbi:hypothetical protein LQ953_12575 [Sphingomonas sp. IC-56]|uniref:hypothetical protein n=1 Tax=Sphingomonas sp. IC-56 TaxID=2898529 RepID=UPI001E546F95|nr:hypothetical protein [Sphingomonas sp. IC-56]MCD2324850.1 hypothetical protein [Sphingomonas sp. IC-56]